MDPRFEANRVNWESRVGIHARSAFYDVENWLVQAPGPLAREADALGDLRGKSVVHLQCHFGMDTLRLARAGAVVVGVDFSSAAIDEATALAARAGLSDRSTFVCANVYDAPTVLLGRQFDLVYVSLGSLCWLSDIAAWGKVVARLLVPGGRLFVHDVHPFSESLDDSGERVTYGYFEEPDHPLVFESTRTYTDGEEIPASLTYEWNHSIGEIVTALISQGLALDSLTEHDWTVFQQFPWLVASPAGIHAIPEDRVRIPLSFTLLAHRV